MKLRAFLAGLAAIPAMEAAMPDLTTWKPNYDEAHVPPYVLPTLLAFNDGTPVRSASEWVRRRAEILGLFEEHVYGRMPGIPAGMSWEVFESEAGALGGRAIRRQIRIRFGTEDCAPCLDLLLYLPREAPRPVPVFLACNFRGNHTIHADPGIRLPQSWMPDDETVPAADNRATEAGRGARASRWAVEMLLARGYALATFYYGDVAPDYHDGFANGVHPLFYRDGQAAPAADEWGAIGAWAWGLRRAMDYLVSDGDIDSGRVAVMGHSRLGKTALWAGAADPRFALVISNNSGCGGAALSRRRIGETVWRINTAFPHWFCGNFHGYNERESALPVDQHMLIALMAPRPVYVASAAEDLWADPRGEFLAARAASPVYELLGLPGLPATEMPAVDAPVAGRIGYHVRSGGHDVKPFDWEQYIAFADRHLGRAGR